MSERGLLLKDSRIELTERVPGPGISILRCRRAATAAALFGVVPDCIAERRVEIDIVVFVRPVTQVAEQIN